MLDNKLFINLYILSLDENYELFIPVDEKVANLVNMLDKSVFPFDNKKRGVLLNLYTGVIYNNNDIIRNTDIKNGTKLMLI